MLIRKLHVAFNIVVWLAGLNWVRYLQVPGANWSIVIEYLARHWSKLKDPSKRAEVFSGTLNPVEQLTFLNISCHSICNPFMSRSQEFFSRLWTRRNYEIQPGLG